MTKPYLTKSKRRSRFVSITAVAAWSAIVLLFGAYLAVANDLATKGLERGEMQQELRVAQRERQELSLRAAELQSLDDLGGDPVVSGMVEVGADVQYVGLHMPTIALR